MIKEIGPKENLRVVEAGVSDRLFLICSLVTLSTMAVMVIDFFSRGSFVSPKMDLFYLAVVLVYSLHKEILRWLGEKKSKRNGELFVYAWVALTTTLYIINFLSRDYFSYSQEGYPLGTLRDISLLTIEVLAIFLFTRFLKILKISWRRKRSLWFS